MKQTGYTEPKSLIENPEPLLGGKHIAAVAALVVVLMVCVACAFQMGALAPTFNGTVDVAALSEDPEAYSLEKADGAAYVIVSKNLAETAAKNVCFSVVFNFRGFDTMGESFILIAALAGSLCILRPSKRRRETRKATAEEEAEENG